MSSQENNIICLNCNEETTEELSGSTPTQLGACPKCTSKNLRRNVQAIFSGFQESLKGVTVTATAYFDVITYSRFLLNEAQTLINSGQFDMAVVISHTACEIATEQALFKVITDKRFLSLGKYLPILLKGYQPNNGKVQKLLKMLTGKEVQKQKTFWDGFMKSWKRRIQIVHRGIKVGKPEAENSLKVCTALVDYLNK